MKRHIAVLAAGILLAGCKSTDGPKVASAADTQARPSSTTSSTASAMPSPAADEADRALQFQRCMSDHGVEVETGPKGDVGIQASPGDKRAALRATEACRIYLPGGGDKPTMDAADIEKLRQFSQCVRDHGYPQWPDPDPETGQMKFDDTQGDLGDLKNDPQFVQAIRACENLVPKGGAKG
jgi:hypothetical protein